MDFLHKIRDKLRALPDWAVLVLLMLFALTVRLFYVYGHPLEARDGIYYIQFTQEWFTHGAAALPDHLSIKPPLYCYLARALMYLGVSASGATLCVNLAAGTLLMIPVYLSGRALWKERSAAVWLCALAAVTPLFVKYSCLRLREGLYIFLAFSTVCAWLLALKKIHMLRASAACAFLAVLNLCCRYEAAELLICAALTLPIAALFPGWRWKLAGKTALAFLIGAAIGAAVIVALPGMPNMLAIYFTRIYMQCLGTSVNPL